MSTAFDLASSLRDFLSLFIQVSLSLFFATLHLLHDFLVPYLKICERRTLGAYMLDALEHLEILLPTNTFCATDAEQYTSRTSSGLYQHARRHACITVIKWVQALKPVAVSFSAVQTAGCGARKILGSFATTCVVVALGGGFLLTSYVVWKAVVSVLRLPLMLVFTLLRAIMRLFMYALKMVVGFFTPSAVADTSPRRGRSGHAANPIHIDPGFRHVTSDTSVINPTTSIRVTTPRRAKTKSNENPPDEHLPNEHPPSYANTRSPPLRTGSLRLRPAQETDGSDNDALLYH